MIVNSIINNIKNGTYNTALVRDDWYEGREKFPHPTFTGACFIRLTSDFREIPYSIFIDNNKPLGLYKADFAKEMFMKHGPQDWKTGPDKIDTNLNDLQRLWDVISVIEKNKRQK